MRSVLMGIFIGVANVVPITGLLVLLGNIYTVEMGALMSICNYRKLWVAVFATFLLFLAGCASATSEPQYKDLRQFIPDDADEQVEEMMASSDGPISLLGDSGRISVDTIRATDWSGNYSKTLAELLLLPRDPYIAIEFRCYRGCGAAACTDPDHYHWCTFNCDEPDHYHNFIPSKACEDGWCTDPNHYHWCPYGCREAEHGHLPYQWKYFE